MRTGYQKIRVICKLGGEMSYLGYPDFFEPYIKRVEETRPARVEKRKQGEEFPLMSLEERHDILQYHPDYKEEGRREIKFGRSKGDQSSCSWKKFFEFF